MHINSGIDIGMRMMITPNDVGSASQAAELLDAIENIKKRPPARVLMLRKSNMRIALFHADCSHHRRTPALEQLCAFRRDFGGTSPIVRTSPFLLCLLPVKCSRR